MTAPDLTSLLERLNELEMRVAALENQRQTRTDAGAETSPFWALERLQTEVPQGAVLYTGHINLQNGEMWQWQYGQTTDSLLRYDWQQAAGSLAALGHPLRLRLLRAALEGPRTAAALGESVGLSGGQLYHHLRELQAAGWLHSQARGPYRIPGERVIALLAILTASGLGDEKPTETQTSAESD